MGHRPVYSTRWLSWLLCSGERLNTMMSSYQYRDSHYKDKTVSWTSFLYNANLYTWKDCLYVETGTWCITSSEHQQLLYLTVQMHSKTNASIVFNMLYHDLYSELYLDTLRPRQNGRHVAKDIFKHIFLNEIYCIFILISLKYAPKVRIISMRAFDSDDVFEQATSHYLNQCWPSLLTHICVTWP